MYERMFAWIGKVAVAFSTLDFTVSQIAAKLIDASDKSLVGPLIMEDFPINRTLQIIRKITWFRYIHSKPMIRRIEDFCSAVEKVKENRNLFMHGVWDLTKMDEDKITVLTIRVGTPKIKNGKTTGWKQGLEEKVFTVDELETVCRRILKLYQEGKDLAGQLTPDSMAPNWKKKKP